MPVPLEIIQEPEKAAAVFDPQRLRLLEHLKEPDSASGLARRLQLSRQQVNYHLRELENAELIVLVGERRKGNCVERLLQASALSYLISPEVLGALLPPLTQDRFSSSYLAATAARAVAELAKLRKRADEAGKNLATLTLSAEVRFASPATRFAFATEIAAAFTAVIARYHDDSASAGRTFRVFLGGYPCLKTELGQELPPNTT